MSKREEHTMSAKQNIRTPGSELDFQNYLQNLKKQRTQPAEAKSDEDPPVTCEEVSNDDITLDVLNQRNAAAKAIEREEKIEASQREKERLVGIKMASKVHETASKDVYGSKRPAETNPLTQAEIKKELRKRNHALQPEWDRLFKNGCKSKSTARKKNYARQMRLRSNGMQNTTNLTDIGLLKKNVTMTTKSMALCLIRRG